MVVFTIESRPGSRKKKRSWLVNIQNNKRDSRALCPLPSHGLFSATNFSLFDQLCSDGATPLIDRSRVREPSSVSTISSTRFFPSCSFSNRYIQLVWSLWKVSSLVITRRARSLADTGFLATDWGRADTPSRMIVSVRTTELRFSTGPSHALNQLCISPSLQ